MHQIAKTEVAGDEIRSLIYDKLLPAVEGEPVPNAVLALLTLAALVLDDEIAMEDLQRVVEGCSQYLVTALAVPAGTTGKVN